MAANVGPKAMYRSGKYGDGLITDPESWKRHKAEFEKARKQNKLSYGAGIPETLPWVSSCSVAAVQSRYSQRAVQTDFRPLIRGI
jgi:hypothetical protein